MRSSHNSASGIRSPRRGAAIQEALAVLRNAGAYVEALETHGPGTAVALASQAVRDDFDCVIACGGDGTVNEVLQALVGTDVALGVLPLGTANALATNLGLWATHSFPLFEASLTNGSGVPHVEKISQLLAIRVRNFGGLLRDFAPGATLHSHSLHLVAFNTRSRLDYFRFLMAVLFGRHTFSRHVHLIRADSVDCRPSNGFRPRISAEADGEVLGQLPVRIEIVPDAASLLIPPPPCHRGRRHPETFGSRSTSQAARKIPLCPTNPLLCNSHPPSLPTHGSMKRI